MIQLQNNAALITSSSHIEAYETGFSYIDPRMSHGNNVINPWNQTRDNPIKLPKL